MGRPPYGTPRPGVGDRDYRKQSMCLPDDVVTEMQAEAKRLGKPLSWAAQEAWRLARTRIGTLFTDPLTKR